jgi:peptidoglycan/LPS O-acetylase OafA/YrhL
MSEWRLGHRPGLDGLRGVAILLVILSHFASVSFGPFHHSGDVGTAGVDLFFALSGFLITALLLEELADRGRVSMRAFYARRSRRLFPALAATCIAFLVFQALTDVRAVPHLWPVVFYVGNWTEAHSGTLGLLSPTWSLSIEEQFYLLWPVTLIASTRWRNGPAVVAASGILISAVLKVVLFIQAGTFRVQYGSDTQAGALLAGALLAILAHRGLRPLPARTWMIVTLAAAQVAWIVPAAPVTQVVLAPIVVPMIGVVLIWAICSSPPGPLASNWLRYVGRRSYALYLWHFGVLWLMLLSVGHSLVAGLVGVAISFALA